MKKRVLAIIAVFTIFSLLCSCSDGQETDSLAETQVQQSVREQPTTAPSDALRIYSYSPDTLNPIFTLNNANMNMLKLIFEPLIWCDNDLRTIPILAESWNVSADGKTWTIKIRSGVKFHDGTALTSGDVAASLRAAQNQESHYKTNMEGVESITPISGAVQIRLNRPQVNFINRLEVPIAKAARASVTADFAPVGTGPYKYGELNNKVVDLSCNHEWWNSEKPSIEKVEVHLLPDKNTAMFAHDANEIDVVPTDTINAGKYVGSQDTSVVYYDTTNFIFLGINNQRKYLSDVNVRKAIAYGINKTQMNEKLLQSNANPTDTFVNPSWYYYNDTGEKHTYSTAISKELLNQAGFDKNNLTIELLVERDSDEKRYLSDFFVQAMSEIEVKVRVKSVQMSDYTAMVSRNDYDVFIGEISQSSDASPEMLLSSGEGGTAGNYFRYSNPEMDILLEQLSLSEDTETAKENYKKIQQLYSYDLPFIGLYYKKAALLVNNRIEGDITPIRNNIFYNINKWHIRK